VVETFEIELEDVAAVPDRAPDHLADGAGVEDARVAAEPESVAEGERRWIPAVLTLDQEGVPGADELPHEVFEPQVEVLLEEHQVIRTRGRPETEDGLVSDRHERPRRVRRQHHPLDEVRAGAVSRSRLNLSAR
jgi:hypothetical protein